VNQPARSYTYTERARVGESERARENEARASAQ